MNDTARPAPTLDLEVQLAWGKGGTYKASATWEGYAAQSKLEVDVEGALAALRIGAVAASREVSRPGPPPPRNAGAATRVGAALFHALFSGAMREAYGKSRQAAEKAGKPWRLVLVIDADPLARVPWELLHDPDKSQFLACTGSVVRRPATGGRDAPPPVVKKVHISWLAASPRGQQALDLARERAVLDQALSAVPGAARPEVTAVTPPTPEELVRLLHARRDDRGLAAREAHILHFACHGEPSDEENGKEGGLVLQKPDGGSHTVSASILAAAILEDPSVRLVVLNACHGAASTSEDALSSVAALLSARGVPAVVGMSTAILDELAVLLTSHFYEGLLRNQRVDEALRAARQRLQVDRAEWVENGPWASPVLWLSGEGADELARLPATAVEDPGPPPPPAELVYLAAPADREHLVELGKHLRPALRSSRVTDWHAGQLREGVDREAAQDRAIAAARVVVLLISPDYLDDPLCHRGQAAALARREEGLLRVVPVYVRVIDDWRAHPFGHLTSTPRANKGAPVDEQPGRDRAWAEVAGDVRKVLAAAAAKATT